LLVDLFNGQIYIFHLDEFEMTGELNHNQISSVHQTKNNIQI